ncbi:MAG: Trk system potassium transporter TrkA [Magnetococcales bacterium]|nr:Trk system potassium transporter TrkA [Magnetococcales bacterium]
MNIVIIGATPMGAVLAKYMVEEGHDVHVVDPDQEAIAQLLTHLDVRALQGSMQDPAILDEVHIHAADLVLVVTHSDTNNIVTALGLHSLAPRARVAILVRDEQFTANAHIWNSAQLEQVVQLTPEQNAIHLVMELLEIPLAFEVASFLEGRIHIAGFLLHEDSPLIGKKLCDLDKSQENRTLVVAVDRHNKTIIPTGDFVFAVRDRLYIPLLAGRKLSDAFEFMGLEQSLLLKQKTHYLIGGGGCMALQLASQLEAEGLRVTLIEKDRQRGVALVDRLSKTRVLHGDVTDPVLLQEMIDPTTTYIALTGNQEINFMSSVLVRRLGAKRAITLFDNEGYIAISAFMGVDAAIHPKFTTIGQVMTLLRPQEVLEAQLMLGGKLEAQLVKVGPDSPLVGKPLRLVGLPKGVVVAARQREGQLVLPDGTTVFHSGDQVLLISDRQDKVRRKMRQLTFMER